MAEKEYRNNYFAMQNLSVGYNKKSLIEDICINIKKGEIVTLIGPNGAGKSTILKSITRQLAIIGGNVLFESSDITSMSFRELSTKMAVVLTDRLKPELLTCHDIVATGRFPYTGRLGILSHEDEDKVDAALAAVNALDLGNRTIMMNDGRIITDISGPERSVLKVSDLLELFRENAGTSLDNDRILLQNN